MCRGSGAAKITQVVRKSPVIKTIAQETPQADKKEQIEKTQETENPISLHKKTKLELERKMDNNDDIESFRIKGISKEQAHTLVAQMANFCKIYANVDGYAVMDGSENGGIFLRNVCKVFKDTNFVSRNKFTRMIFKIREYTKREATLNGELINFTQIVENEGTLEREVSFGSKYINIVPSTNHLSSSLLESHLDTLTEMYDIDYHQSDDGDDFGKICVTNLSKTERIAVLVELEQNRENRREKIKMLETEEMNSKFIENGFVVIGEDNNNHKFDKVWDEYFVTLFCLSNDLKVKKNVLIYDRRIFDQDYLYFKNNQLYGIDDKTVLLKCYVNRNEMHSLQRTKIDKENINIDINSKTGYLNGCSFCSSKFALGKNSYHCPTCKNYGLCDECCHLIICNKTQLKLNIPQSITQVDQQAKSSMQVMFTEFEAPREELEYKIETQITDGVKTVTNWHSIKWPQSQTDHDINDDDEDVATDLITSTYNNSSDQSDADNVNSKFFTLQLSDLEKEFKESQLSCQIQLVIFDPINEIQSSLHRKIKDIPIWVKYDYDCVFNTLNGSGRLGPTNIDKYKNQCHFNDTSLDDKQKGIQLWKVPKTGKYKVVCFGAKGGDSIYTRGNRLLFGGKGAKIGSILNLFANDTIKIVCGQMGRTSQYRHRGGGGGGGTYFVLYQTGNSNPNYKQNEIVNIPLIIAAGGHGACNARDYIVNGVDGLSDTSKNRDKYGGYDTTGQAGRGASFKNDFDIFRSYRKSEKIDYNVCNPKSFLNGAVGGSGFDQSSPAGGFGGGGGGSRYEGGAGGGYIGGLVQMKDFYNHDQTTYSLFGALSYVDSHDNIQSPNVKYGIDEMISGYNNDNGKINVTFLG